jgi:hypothetical protein
MELTTNEYYFLIEFEKWFLIFSEYPYINRMYPHATIEKLAMRMKYRLVSF